MFDKSLDKTNTMHNFAPSNQLITPKIIKDMKQTLKIMAAALLISAFSVQSASAQAKRRPAAKPAAKKPAQKVNNNFAIIELDEWINQPLFEDEENVYFLGIRHSENTLRAVNKLTGDIKLVVPKKKRARPIINCAGSDGKNIYMRVENKGVARFNGTDVNTSELVLEQSEWNKGFLLFGNRGSHIACSPNGRYFLLYGDSPIEYDLEAKKVVRHGVGGIQKAVITNDGLQIAIEYYNMYTATLHPNPTIDTGSPKNAVGKKEYKLDKIGNGAGGSFCGLWYDVPADTVYVALGEQVLKSPAKPDLKFEEVYCLPGENKKFTNYVCNGQRVFALTDNYEKKIYEWDNKDMKGAPKISKEIDTGIIDKRHWEGNTTTMKISDAQRLYYDKAGNLWVQVNDGRFIIYNPDGIKGLTNLKGKITENKLPKEED